jgi:hypothetical protein
MAGNGTRRLDAVLIAQLAGGATHEHAAAAAGCSKTTVARRLRDPRFRAAIDASREQLFEAAFGRIVSAAQAASGTLIALLAREAPYATRLGAARTILEASVKFREEHDVEERLKALEERLGK